MTNIRIDNIIWDKTICLIDTDENRVITSISLEDAYELQVQLQEAIDLRQLHVANESANE